MRTLAWLVALGALGFWLAKDAERRRNATAVLADARAELAAAARVAAPAAEALAGAVSRFAGAPAALAPVPPGPPAAGAPAYTVKRGLA